MGFLKKIFGVGGGNKNSSSNNNGNGKTTSGGGSRKNNKRNNNGNNSSNTNVNHSINSSFATSEDVLPSNSPSPQKFLTPSNSNSLNNSYSSAGRDSSRGGRGYHNNNQQPQRQMMMTSPRGGSGSRGSSNTSFDGSGMRRSSRPASINAIDLDEDDDDVLAAMNMNSPIVTPRQTQEELRAAYESSQRALKASGGSGGSGSSGSGKHRGFNENSNYSDYSNNISGSSYGNNSRLTPHQLQQWDMGGMPSSRPMFTMSSDLPRQQMEAMDDMNRSDASSSSFNLSTDAEDSEYETLRRRGVYPIPGTSTLDTSNALDNVSLSYTTDEDRSKIFPNLPTDDEMTQSTEPSLTYYPQPPPSLLGLDPSEIADSSHFPPTMDIQPTTTGASLRAWSVQNPPMMGATSTTSSAAAASSSMTNTSSPAKIAISTVASPSSRSPPQSELPSTTRSSTSRDHHFFGGGPDSSESPSPTSSKSVPKTLTTTASTPAASASTAVAGMNMDMRKAPPISSSTNINTSTNYTVSRNTPGKTPREFTTPKEFISSPPKSSSQHGGDVRTGGFSSDFASDFGNFADFTDFSTTNDGDWNEEKKEQRWDDMNDAGGPKTFSRQNGWGTAAAGGAAQADRSNHQNADSLKETSGFDDPPFDNEKVASSQASGSSTGFQQDWSLSDVLEVAKSKGHRRTESQDNRISGWASSGSVNSAPAITAAYLRQRHNLGRNSSGAYNKAPVGSTNDQNRSNGEATSVSDIIQSLEAMKPSGDAKVYAHHSVGETGAVSTVRLAKERLRDRRRRSRERHGISNSRPADSDSDESDHEASESWLFDEVTGALGPRGIAADLESLSGRSNRSKNSHGGKSHKSSRRKSSRKSSSRRHRSDRSVDSHGSRASRNSRHSHRSTKSYLSQMSEQSRSVANDLLRLEMQLAMVSSSEEKRDDAAGRLGSGSASLGGSSLGGSRPSHRRSSSARAAGSSPAAFANSSSPMVIQRQKTKIIAPPGKLGIILANKSDSRGTVVSGVRETSVLVDQISQGDRIVAIDGEDVSRMTVSEITTIMSRKSEYERTLTVLTIPRTIESTGSAPSPTSTASADNGGLGSPSNQQSPSAAQFDNRFSSFGR
eukprot:CAMPEP_0113482194 /NCGR_PEP_ID=MMETSP0014_2-20120614/22793_1 /TAXON_ID=2857 /ORGANISM="Nitzschia sp." /LENGTH=1111 /DNA_ID=CAMNT_0000375703 /DNA_START=183 /DNA_END=3518 /DNA_ORIENTATION=- /assembly_acc=CAM_ASM_000159